MLNQFHVNLHLYILDIVDVRSDGHYGYMAVRALLCMVEDFWSLVCNNLHKELGQWHDEYANIFGGYDHFYQIKQSLLINHVSMVSVLLRRDKASSFLVFTL